MTWTTVLVVASLLAPTWTAAAQDTFEPETDGDRLAEAIDSGSIAAVRRVLDDGVSADTSVYGTPALQWAIWDNRYFVVKLLVERGADVNLADEIGYTSLMAACDIGNKKIASLLLEKGAEINAVEKGYGMNALQCACAASAEELVDLLLEKGANVKHIDQHGGNCLEEAAFCGSKSIVEKLRAKGLTTKWPLHVACGLGDLEEVKKLIASGKKVNKKNGGWQNTPLQFAAGGGHVKVAKLLIENGAKMDTRNVEGATLLHIAATKESLAFTKWLVEQGADINAKDHEGMTPLDWADEQATAYLEELGAEYGELMEEDESVEPQ